jgi:hypothetical protein
MAFRGASLVNAASHSLWWFWAMFATTWEFENEIQGEGTRGFSFTSALRAHR